MLQLSRFSTGRRWLGTIFFIIFVLPLSAQTQKKIDKADYFSKGTLVAGNGIYEVAIEDFIQEGVGLYTVRTGPSHPITRRFNSKQDLLGGGTAGARGLPGTSYTTIRSYASRTEYVQSRFAASDTASGFKTVWLDSALFNDFDFADSADYITPIGNPLAPSGYRITFELPGLLPEPRDKMRLVQKVSVRGSSFDDAWVEISTVVENTGSQTLEIGVRYLWDLNISGDDGPEVFEKLFNTSLGHQEKRIDWLNFPFAMAKANDRIGARPAEYNVFASVVTPTNFLRTPFLPARLQLVSWPLAFFKAFDYEVDENLTISTPADPNAGLTGGDNALQYFWGQDQGRALIILPGDSVQVTQILLASLEDFPPLFDFEPPACELAAVNPGPPKSFEFVVQDPVSGLRMLRALNVSNANVAIPDFATGSTEMITIVGTVIDETQPFGFTLAALDLSGNEALCDPIFLTLLPELHTNEQRFEPIFSDRYFYIKNQGIRRIVANLNGHEFTLSTAPLSERPARNVFAMPVKGEMTIDMLRYMKKEGNTMTIAFDGPLGSRADLIISDMPMKSRVDLILQLTEVPRQFALLQNSPNPFNPFNSATTIRFDLPETANSSNGMARVELKIYNLLGQLVRTLAAADFPAGSHQIKWDGRDGAGRRVQAGVYLYDLNFSGMRLTKKLALLR
jgi:hypothetical protein